MNTIKLFTCLLFIGSLTTQINGQDMLDAIAQETCDCISKRDLDNMNQDQINLELGLCMMESFTANEGKFEEKLEVDITDQNSINKFAEKIGFRMAVKCPTVLQKVATTTSVTQEETVAESVIKGTIKDITDGDFSYLIVVDENGREHKLLWLRYFKGSEKLIGNSTAMKGKKVSVTYAPIECYSPKAKDYNYKKEIKGLELQ